MKNLLACLLPCAAFALPAAAGAQTTVTDGQALRADLLQHYPSLAWVERYRQAFPGLEGHGLEGQVRKVDMDSSGLEGQIRKVDTDSS